jgi:hypothetical protein
MIKDFPEAASEGIRHFKSVRHLAIAFFKGYAIET